MEINELKEINTLEEFRKVWKEHDTMKNMAKELNIPRRRVLDYKRDLQEEKWREQARYLMNL